GEIRHVLPPCITPSPEARIRSTELFRYRNAQRMGRSLASWPLGREIRHVLSPCITPSPEARIRSTELFRYDH
ncbi:hypothetical protein A0J61_11450, partial [Choanephora cucurbitarum]